MSNKLLAKSLVTIIGTTGVGKSQVGGVVLF
jgi:tRNA A37 N6-isopentenylltransferase MiaA